MVEYSTVVSIIYFSVNILFMFALALYVYKSGNHELKTKSDGKSYFKDIWNQRKIFWPLIIHFYDTATDIGVIYNWGELMADEKAPDFNYESVDMESFFWCGVTFLIVFRVGMLMYSVFEWCRSDGEWWHILLVLVDLYIFVVVYESFQAANDVITDNAAKRKRNAEKRKQKRQEEIDKKLELAVDAGDISTAQATEIKAEMEKEVEPGEAQMILQLCEAVTESMPQIVLQSVFIIRSANDTKLSADGGSNLPLLLFSVLASLFSISNKFVWFDKEVKAIAKGAIYLKPSPKCPHCIQYWYVIRAVWRLCHVFSKFAAFTLIWTVLGGAWLPIWTGICYVFWWIVLMVVINAVDSLDRCEDWCEAAFTCSAYGLGYLVAMVFASTKYKIHFIFKCLETTVAFTVITIFATTSFKCDDLGDDICADASTRMLFNFNDKSNNNRIFMYWILGIVAHVMDVVLYLALYLNDIFTDKTA
eukprot:431309_1